jgi:hypothetical protein
LHQVLQGVHNDTLIFQKMIGICIALVHRSGEILDERLKLDDPALKTGNRRL